MVTSSPSVERRPRDPPPRTAPRPLLVALVALVLVGCGIGAYVGARQTGVFSLDRIAVDGAPRTTAGRIRAALSPCLGESLVRFDRREAERRLASVPAVAEA